MSYMLYINKTNNKSNLMVEEEDQKVHYKEITHKNKINNFLKKVNQINRHKILQQIEYQVN
jgi:hypothetical protein